MTISETYTSITPCTGRIVTIVKANEPRAVYKVTSIMPGYITDPAFPSSAASQPRTGTGGANAPNHRNPFA